MNATHILPTAKNKLRRKQATFFRNYLVPALWAGFMLYGILLCSLCVLMGLFYVTLFDNQLPVDALTTFFIAAGLIGAVMLPVMIWHLVTSLQQVYRRRIAAIGFRLERQRIAKLKRSL